MFEDDVVSLLGRPPRLRYHEIVANPRMPDARRAYLDQFLKVYSGDPFMVRLMIESGRFLVCHLALLLHAAQDPARPETWFTASRLKQEMTRYRLGSPRQVDYLIARLRSVGFLESMPAEQDRRVRILRPSESLLAHDRLWLAAHYAPLAYLYPHHDYSPIMRLDRDFQVEHRRAGIDFWPLGMKILLSSPEIMLFFNHAGGVMVLASLLRAAMNMQGDNSLPVSYREIGDPFGISRTHVRQLIQAAQAAGMMKLSGRGESRVEIMPRLWSGYDRSLAGGMYLHDVVYLAALRQTDRGSA